MILILYKYEFKYKILHEVADCIYTLSAIKVFPQTNLSSLIFKFINLICWKQNISHLIVSMYYPTIFLLPVLFSCLTFHLTTNIVPWINNIFVPTIQLCRKLFIHFTFGDTCALKKDTCSTYKSEFIYSRSHKPNVIKTLNSYPFYLKS